MQDKSQADVVGAFRHDFLASIVVFLVALPLCMGVAIASGAPPEKAASVGIVTGIVGGIVVGLLGGSPLQVSGPAAGLSVLVMELTRQHGWDRLGAIVLLAGAMQVMAGLLKLGQWFRAVSPAVIQGMLAGIGVLIFSSQFHIMLDDSPKESGLRNLLTLPEAVYKGVVPTYDVAHDDAARIGLVAILSLVAWKAFAPKRLVSVPAPLVGVLSATAVTAVWTPPVKLVAIPDNVWQALQLPVFPHDLASWEVVLFEAASLAIIASAETLLTATAVDKMHHGPRTRYDRELTVQGVGNVLCGLAGALPITGVIVRSAANVDAGARTRAATVMHGLWLLLVVGLVPAVLRSVPTSALAALLVYTGYKLVNPRQIVDLWRLSRGEAAIYVATLVGIVATDLLTGVLVGIGLAFAKLMLTFSRLQAWLTVDPETRHAVLHLAGSATFVRLPKLANMLEQVPPSTRLTIRFEGLGYIDHACLDLLANWARQHEATGGTLTIDWETLRSRFTAARTPA